MNRPDPACAKDLIANCLLSERAMACAVSSGVETEWFTEPNNRQHWGTMVRHFGGGRWIDYMTYASRYAVDLPAKGADLEPSIERSIESSTEGYIAECRGVHLRRQAAAMHAQTAATLQDTTGDVDAQLATIQAGWTGLLDHRGSEEPLDAIAARLLDQWQNAPASAPVARFPLTELHDGIGPLTDEIVYLIATPSIGKTAFAVQMCVCLAHAKIRSSLRSLESSREKIAQRIMAQVGRLNTYHLRTRKAMREEYDAARSVLPILADVQQYMRVNDQPASIPQLQAWACSEKAARSKLLVVDNLKHIRSDSRKRSTVEEIRELSAGVKTVRDSVRLPVVMLHHASDEGKAAWSRDIERDADIVIFMEEIEKRRVVPSAANNWTGEWWVEFAVKKAREGASWFKVVAKFDKAHQRFVEDGNE